MGLRFEWLLPAGALALGWHASDGASDGAEAATTSCAEKHLGCVEY